MGVEVWEDGLVGGGVFYGRGLIGEICVCGSQVVFYIGIWLVTFWRNYFILIALKRIFIEKYLTLRIVGFYFIPLVS